MAYLKIYSYKIVFVSVAVIGIFDQEYFANYFLHMSDVTFDMQKNNMSTL